MSRGSLFFKKVVDAREQAQGGWVPSHPIKIFLARPGKKDAFFERAGRAANAAELRLGDARAGIKGRAPWKLGRRGDRTGAGMGPGRVEQAGRPPLPPPKALYALPGHNKPAFISITHFVPGCGTRPGQIPGRFNADFPCHICTCPAIYLYLDI